MFYELRGLIARRQARVKGGGDREIEGGRARKGKKGEGLGGKQALITYKEGLVVLPLTVDMCDGFAVTLIGLPWAWFAIESGIKPNDGKA